MYVIKLICTFWVIYISHFVISHVHLCNVITKSEIKLTTFSWRVHFLAYEQFATIFTSLCLKKTSLHSSSASSHSVICHFLRTAVEFLRCLFFPCPYLISILTSAFSDWKNTHSRLTFWIINQEIGCYYLSFSLRWELSTSYSNTENVNLFQGWAGLI